jgi:hypothetical protein
VGVDELAAAACEEIQRDACLGEAAVSLLYAVMREETRRFPVLRPLSGWTPDAVMDLTHAFFVKKVERLTAELTAIGVTGEITGKVMRTWVRNWLVEEARKTPLGRIRRKLEEDVLPVDPACIRVQDGLPGAGRWFLDGQSSDPYGGGTEPLIRAAYGVPGVKAVRWSGPRRRPIASDQDLRAIVCAVLSAAGGSLEIGQIVHVLAKRFPAAAEPDDCMLDDDTFLAVCATDDATGIAVVVSEAVLDVYDQLSPSQRALLPLMPVEDIATVMDLLGAGRTQAYAAVSRLKELLNRILPADETRPSVLAGVVERCGSS